MICYDAVGNYIGDIWLFDSFKATGSTSTFRHCTEVITPQSHYYLRDSAKREDVHFISLTFGNYAEGSQTGSTALYRNVSITKDNELFDMAEWAFRSANRLETSNGTYTSGTYTLDYDSGTKTLTVTSKSSDTATARPKPNATDLKTHRYETDGGSYPFYYTPVLPNTTYTFEGLYAGTGNGDFGVNEYTASGAHQKSTWNHKDSVSGFLTATGSSDEFKFFSISLTTTEQTRYILLSFGGYPNSSASSSNPVTNVFRDVKMHLSTVPSVPNTDSVYTYYYRPNQYKVSFDGNSNTGGTMNSQIFTYGESQALTTNAYTRAYSVSYNTHSGSAVTTPATATYSFAGWATTAGGSATYSNQQSVSNLTSTDHATVTLYAKWSGGSVTLPTTTRTGYTLQGWYTAESGGTKVGNAGDGYTATGNITLHAQWQIDSHNVTYNYSENGGSSATKTSDTVNYNAAIDLTPTATKTTNSVNWTFVGWNTDKTATTGLTSLSMGTSDVTLYAIYSCAPKARFYYVNSSGTATYTDKAYDTAYNKATSASGKTATVTSSSSWTEKGYSTSTTYSASGNTAENASITTSTMKNGSVVATYYMNYNRTVTVTFNENGGTWSNTTTYPKTKTGEATWNCGAEATNATIALYTGTPVSRTGYTFNGWNTKADGSGTTYSSGGTYTGTADITLYAKWLTNHTVTYDYVTNGGSSATTTSASVAETHAISFTPTATKSGWVFVGWNTSSTATTAMSSLTMGTENVTLYAIFSCQPKARFHYIDANGTQQTTDVSFAKVYNTATTSSGTAKTVTSISGWTEKGWSTGTSYADSGNTAEGGSISTNDMRDNTVVAHYYMNYSKGVTVTFDQNGGTWGNTTTYPKTKTGTAKWNANDASPMPVSVTTYKTPAATMTGCHIGSWNTAADGSGTSYAVDTAYNFTTSPTLYAQWAANQYDVRYNMDSGSLGTGAANNYTGHANQAYTASVTIRGLTGDTNYYKTGYTFRGWADASGKTSADDVVYMAGTSVAVSTIAGNQNKAGSSDAKQTLTLYAVWTIDSHTVTYNYAANGGSSATKTSASVRYNAAIDLTPTATKTTEGEDWTFVGWNTDQNATTALSSLNMGTSDVTLYAIYSCTPKARFYYIDSSGTRTYTDKDYNTVYNNATTATGNAATVTSSSSWTEKGYSTSTTYSASGNIAENAGISTATLENGGVVATYYMNYSRTVTVTFNENGGTWSSDTTTYPKTRTGTATWNAGKTSSTNPTIALYNGTPVSRSNYAFNGWNTASNGTGTNYASGGNYTSNADVTLYAKWLATHRVVYNRTENGGTAGSNTNATVAETREIDLTPTAEKSGWVFVGWNTDKTATTGLENLTMGMTNVTLYAIYSCQPIARFHYIGTNGAQKTTDVNFALVYNKATTSSGTAPTVSSISGWTEDGWSAGTSYADSGNTAEGGSISTSDLRDDTVVAHYYMNYSKGVTVTFNENGGTWGSTTTYPKTKSGAATWNAGAAAATGFAATTYKTPAATKTGYHIASWNTKADGTGTSYSVDTSYNFTTSLTLYAQWAVNTYDVKYNMDSGSLGTGAANNYTGHANQAYTASVTIRGLTGDTNYYKTGYTFGGWADASGKTSASDVVYTAGTSVAVSTIAANQDKAGSSDAKQTLTLYAVWTKKTFTLAFDMNGVTATAPDSKTLSYDTANTYGGTGAGANAAIAASTVNSWFGAVGEGGTKTVYAIWQKTLTGTFTDTTGSQTADVTIYNGAANGTITAPTQRDYTGWTKKGWTTSTAADGAIASNFTITANTQYYGRYARTLTVTYEKNGGKTTPSATSVTQQMNAYSASTWTNANATLAAEIERDGYTFAGWKIGTTNYGANASYPITANVTATAQWSRDPYTVTFDADGGANVNAIDYTIESSSTLPATTKHGYTFGGWKAKTAVGNWNTTDTYAAGTSLNGKWGTVELKAQWTKQTFTLKFDMNGVTATAPANKTLSYDTAGSYGAAPTNVSGSWTFRGWSESAGTTSGTVAGANAAIAASTVNSWFDAVGGAGQRRSTTAQRAAQ